MPSCSQITAKGTRYLRGTTPGGGTEDLRPITVEIRPAFSPGILIGGAVKRPDRPIRATSRASLRWLMRCDRCEMENATISLRFDSLQQRGQQAWQVGRQAAQPEATGQQSHVAAWQQPHRI